MDKVERWEWFQKNRGRLVSRPRLPTALTLPNYTSACLNGMPPSGVVFSAQIERAWPLAVEWELGPPESTAPWPPVGPTGPIASALCWPGAGLELGDTVIASVFVEWSINGVKKWQICDAHDRGRLVIGGADWVRVSYLTIADGDDNYKELTAEITVSVRPAEMAEVSLARVSISPFRATTVAPSTVLCWLGALVDDVQIDQHGITASAIGFSFRRSDLAVIASHTTAVVSVPNVSAGGVPSAFWRGILPPGTTYIQTGCSGAGGSCHTTVVGRIR